MEDLQGSVRNVVKQRPVRGRGGSSSGQKKGNSQHTSRHSTKQVDHPAPFSQTDITIYIQPHGVVGSKRKGTKKTDKSPLSSTCPQNCYHYSIHCYDTPSSTNVETRGSTSSSSTSAKPQHSINPSSENNSQPSVILSPDPGQQCVQISIPVPLFHPKKDKGSQTNLSHLPSTPVVSYPDQVTNPQMLVSDSGMLLSRNGMLFQAGNDCEGNNSSQALELDRQVVPLGLAGSSQSKASIPSDTMGLGETKFTDHPLSDQNGTENLNSLKGTGAEKPRAMPVPGVSPADGRCTVRSGLTCYAEVALGSSPPASEVDVNEFSKTKRENVAIRSSFNSEMDERIEHQQNEEGNRCTESRDVATGISQLFGMHKNLPQQLGDRDPKLSSSLVLVKKLPSPVERKRKAQTTEVSVPQEQINMDIEDIKIKKRKHQKLAHTLTETSKSFQGTGSLDKSKGISVHPHKRNSQGCTKDDEKNEAMKENKNTDHRTRPCNVKELNGAEKWQSEGRYLEQLGKEDSKKEEKFYEAIQSIVKQHRPGAISTMLPYVKLENTGVLSSPRAERPIEPDPASHSATVQSLSTNLVGTSKAVAATVSMDAAVIRNIGPRPFDVPRMQTCAAITTTGPTQCPPWSTVSNIQETSVLNARYSGPLTTSRVQIPPGPRSMLINPQRFAQSQRWQRPAHSQAWHEAGRYTPGNPGVQSTGAYSTEMHLTPRQMLPQPSFSQGLPAHAPGQTICMSGDQARRGPSGTPANKGQYDATITRPRQPMQTKPAQNGNQNFNPVARTRLSALSPGRAQNTPIYTNPQTHPCQLASQRYSEEASLKQPCHGIEDKQDLTLVTVDATTVAIVDNTDTKIEEQQYKQSNHAKAAKPKRKGAGGGKGTRTTCASASGPKIKKKKESQGNTTGKKRKGRPRKEDKSCTSVTNKGTLRRSNRATKKGYTEVDSDDFDTYFEGNSTIFQGKKIMHRWIAKEGPRWYQGRVLEILKGIDGEPDAVYLVDYAEDGLFEVSNLNKCFEEGDLRIVEDKLKSPSH